ncbi:MAG: DUF4097 family beta strand repeat protein [Lachnospiraceae bacterium]|nr:DUF4097 family beta strand repeat protein [Lachnospiraceae bacterium]
MNSDEFLKELQYKLRGLPETERINAVRFFEEYIHKANLSPGTDVTTICGTPEEAARQVMSGSIDNKSVKRSIRAHETKEQKESRHNGILGLLIVLALLISGGLVTMGVLGLAFDFKHFKFYGSSNRITESVTNISEFSTVDVDSDVSKVELIADGDDYRVDYSLPTDDLKYEVNGGKLTLKYDSPNVWGFLKSGNNYITIHVPKGTDMGDVTLNSDTGAVALTDITCKTAKLDTDTGSTKVNGSHATSMELSSSTGSINVDKTTVENTLNIDADTGSIHIDNSSFKDAILESDTGSLHVNNTSFDNIEANLDTGSIHIDAPGKAEEYSLELETDTGNVYIDDNKEGKSYSSSGTTDKGIKAETDTGSVRINFD